MSQEIDNSDKLLKEQLGKSRRKGLRLFLTWSLIVLGCLLFLGTILDLAPFGWASVYIDEIHHFTQLLFISCIALICIVLGFERSLDFDTIEKTLEKHIEVLKAQNQHFVDSKQHLEDFSKTLQGSTTNLKNLILKIDELTSKISAPTVLKEVNWKSLIKQADEIDFLVQGWDGWMDHHSTELEDFFKRGGKFQLFVVNPEGPETAHVRKLMERRLDKTSILVESEIVNTILKIQDIFKEAGGSASDEKLEVFYLNEVNWYFAARFKSEHSDSRDALVLSFYSHHRYLLKETPAIIIYRDSSPSVFKWFDAELTKLRN